MNTLLYGHDPEECIVDVHQLDECTMRLYTRDAAGVHHRDERFYPFFFLSQRSHLEGFQPRHWIKELEGRAHYRYVCAFESWPALWDAVRFILERHNRTSLTKVDHYASLETISLTPDPVTQYLLQSGKTFFKQMQFSDLHRLQLDIETYSPIPGQFGRASRPGDRIILVALSDNRGWLHLLDGKELTEQQMLATLVELIREKDPDVIEGHNIYEFDLPYILKRCELHQIPFAIGRDGSTPQSPFARGVQERRSIPSVITEVGGRHIIDTLTLVRNYDQSKRNMESHGLKYAAQYFGIVPQNRTYIPSEKISWYWEHDPEPLRRYAMDDVFETRGISEHLSGTYFYLTQMLPMSYSTVLRSGSATKIEHLLLRGYLRQRHSVPRPGEGYQTMGGYTDIFAVGMLEPILHVDIESLYPSIMISKAIRPRSDVLGLFTSLLKELTTLRIQAKRRMMAADDPQEHSRLDATQSSLKILINSFYGYLGYSRGMFNDYASADEVTRSGQEILRQMILSIQSKRGTVIEVDTDGIFFVPSEIVRTEEDERHLVDSLCRELPEGITVALEGRYRKMLSYKKKNYALLDYEGNIRIKGSALTSRSIERFGRNYIRTCVSCLLNGNIAGLHSAYIETRELILNHKLTIRDFAKVESLTDTASEYLQAVEAGKRSRSAAYEIALASDKPLRRGDRVAYYVTGDDPNPRSFDNCKPAAEWDPNFPDENIPYYLRRVDEYSEKFKPFFSARDHHRIFSVDDLFPFSPQEISILDPKLSPNTLSDKEDMNIKTNQ